MLFIYLKFVSFFYTCFVAGENFVTFDSMVQFRKRQSQSSIIVKVSNWKYLSSVYSVCKEYGDIKNVFEFQTDNEKVS